MLKQKLILLFILLCNNNIYSHGFGKNIFISLANNRYQTIENLCTNAQTQQIYPSVLTYKENTKKSLSKKVKSIAIARPIVILTLDLIYISHAQISFAPQIKDSIQ
jgi:hypothetical protein